MVSPVTWDVIFGLVVGKPLGILLASVIAGALGYLVLREVLTPPREETA